MSERLVILVDGEGREVGTREVRAAHEGKGQLHRAFTIPVFDSRGRLLLAKRAPGKMLWPGFWDGTVASHPLPEESTMDAAFRRLDEELKLDIDLVELGEFEYSVPFGKVGSETERCQTYFGVIEGDPRIEPNPEEVSELAWVELEQLFEPREQSVLCPWLSLALLRAASGRVPGGPAGPIVQRLIGYSEGAEQLVQRSMGKHDWRLLDI